MASSIGPLAPEAAPGSTEATSTRRELPNLTGIRALAAGWVVAEHFRIVGFALVPEADFLRPWVESGYLGVEVFFILSGFIIAYNYLDRFRIPSLPNFRAFIIARFARIYPTHFVTLVIMVVLVVGATRLGLTLSAAAGYTVGSLLGNVFMLQALPAVPAWNPPAWSISAEFAAYLSFPLVALMVGRIASGWLALVIACSLTLSGGVAMAVLQLDNFSATGGVLIALRIAIEFSAGCLLFIAWSKLRVARQYWTRMAVVAAVLVGCSIAVLGSGLALAVVPLIAVLVLSCASAGGVVSAVLSSRIMMWGGRISYSVYMTHFIVIMVLPKLIRPSRFDGSPLLLRSIVLLVFFLVAVLVGWACHELIEKPGRDLIKRWSAPDRRLRATDGSIRRRAPR